MNFRMCIDFLDTLVVHFQDIVVCDLFTEFKADLIYFLFISFKASSSVRFLFAGGEDIRQQPVHGCVFRALPPFFRAKILTVQNTNQIHKYCPW